MGSSFGYFPTPNESSIFGLNLTEANDLTSFYASGSGHSTDSNTFDIEEVKFENEEEDKSEDFHKHFFFLYSITLEIPRCTGDSYFSQHHPGVSILQTPIFIFLGQLIL
jgi:hypothetical protein